MKKIKRRIKLFFKNFRAALSKPEMMVLPGQLAFFFVLSVVPTITLIGYTAGILNISTDSIFNFMSKAFNKSIASYLIVNPTKAMGIKSILTIVVGYYFASNGASSIIVTSNTIYGIENTSFLKRRLKAFLMTFIIVLLFIFMVIVPVFGNKITEMIAFVNMNQKVTDRVLYVFNFIKGPITWFIMFFFIKILYTMAPDKKVESRYVNKGAIFTTFGWVVATYIYSYYISHFAQYDVFYGNLSNIIVLMLWFLLLAYILTLGIAMNHRVEKEELEKTAKLNIVNE